MPAQPGTMPAAATSTSIAAEAGERRARPSPRRGRRRRPLPALGHRAGRVGQVEHRRRPRPPTARRAAIAPPIPRVPPVTTREPSRRAGVTRRAALRALRSWAAGSPAAQSTSTITSSTPASASAGSRGASSAPRPADSTIRSTTSRRRAGVPRPRRAADLSPASSAPSDCCPSQPSPIAPARRSAGRVPADEHRDLVRRRRQAEDVRRQRVVAAGVRARACRSSTSRSDRDPLLEARAARVERHVERVELLLEPAGADARVEPAAARDVDRGDLLRGHDRLAQRQHEDGRSRDATRSVTAAASASAISASKYGVSVGQVARPSAANG